MLILKLRTMLVFYVAIFHEKICFPYNTPELCSLKFTCLVYCAEKHRKREKTLNNLHSYWQRQEGTLIPDHK